MPISWILATVLTVRIYAVVRVVTNQFVKEMSLRYLIICALLSALISYQLFFVGLDYPGLMIAYIWSAALASVIITRKLLQRIVLEQECPDE